MDLLDRLLGHDDWATRMLLELSSRLTPAQFDEPFDIGHRTLRETLVHMIYNVEFWTSVMTGQQDQVMSGERTLTAWHERSFAFFAAFARRIRDENRWDETFVDHFDSHMTFGGAILHVVLHNAEHRSEALHILSRLGVPDLPEIDHGLWDFKSRGL